MSTPSYSQRAPYYMRPHVPRHSRGYLPHWEAADAAQAITFCLHDALPRALREHWRRELAMLSTREQEIELKRRIEAELDRGRGEAYLRRPEIARLVEGALFHFEDIRYRLYAWCVMPNHVHVVIRPMNEYSLSVILHGWKSFTANQANRILGRRGPFWLREYFHRMIRDRDHFENAVGYAERNAVVAGLCARPEDWPYGSAAARARSRNRGR